MTSGLLGDRPRRTLARDSSLLAGTGLHNGKDVSVQLRPADPFRGRRFRDLGTGQEIEATAANGEESARCTVLRQGEARVQTVEHLLSALNALGIDDCGIDVSGGELPALDGSSFPFISWIKDTGSRDHRVVDLRAAVVETAVLVQGDGGTCLAALPASHFQATVVLDYPQPWIGTQSLCFDALTDDYEQIASARTFGFVQELEWLRARGLGLGASHENALALGQDGYEGTPRFADELVRHKLLDLIGDLALVGAPLNAHVIAIKPSHAINIRLARMLVNQLAGNEVFAGDDGA